MRKSQPTSIKSISLNKFSKSTSPTKFELAVHMNPGAIVSIAVISSSNKHIGTLRLNDSGMVFIPNKAKKPDLRLMSWQMLQSIQKSGLLNGIQ